MYDVLHKDEDCVIVKEGPSEPRNTYIVPKRENDDILIVKIGSEERPASDEDIKNVQIILAQIQNNPELAIITHHCIQFETIPRSCLGGSLIMALGSENKVKKLGS